MDFSSYYLGMLMGFLCTITLETLALLIASIVSVNRQNKRRDKR